MARETMTPSEGLWAAIGLEKPDRVPVVPTMTPESDGGGDCHPQPWVQGEHLMNRISGASWG